MDNISFSYSLICFNEERTIRRCLTAIQDNAGLNDEILVVDTGSSDKTIEIITTEFSNVRLLHYEWANDFADARNFAISVARKNWIFFVDCDEVLSENSGKKIKENIKKIAAVANRPFALVTKIVNSNCYIDYNSGRIFPNDSNFKYYGLVHEYPIYNDDINCTNYDLIQIKDVVIYHDGYEASVMQAKHKFERNSKLGKEMLKRHPRNIRYRYLYYRDSKDLIDEKEYVKGMKEILSMDVYDKFAIFAAFDLIAFYIKSKNFERADEIIDEISKSVEKPEFITLKLQLIYLSSVCEFNKLLVNEGKILKTLLSVKKKYKDKLDEVYLNEVNYEDLIGLIFLSTGNIEEAKEINEKLKKSNYNGQLSQKIIGLKKSKIL